VVFGRPLVISSLLLIVACVAVMGTAALAQQDSDGVRHLDELWAIRNKDPSQRGALEYGRVLVGNEPDNFEAVWRMARITRWLALRQGDDDEKKRFATKAMQWAQRAITLNPHRVEGYFYQMMAVGEYGSTLSVARALYEGIGSKFEHAGLEAYRIDPHYEDGEVMTALGRYYFVLPWPKRDLAKSRRFLEEGATDHPQILMNFVYLAELEYEEGNPSKARTTLEHVLQPVPGGARGETQGEARALARAHLEKWFPATPAQ
jgi:hypothetical protein